MSSIEHPNHRIPDEVVIGISKVSEVELATQKRHDEIAKLARPNEEERRLIAEVRESAAEARGFNREMLQRLRDVRARKSIRVREAMIREEARVYVERPLWDFKPVQPEPADPTFWWAKTDWSYSTRTPAEPDEGSAASFSAESRGDGLHFFGGVTTHNGDLYKDNFGAVALFELQSDRIPQSLSRRWRSTPNVELFGGLLGYTGDDDIFTGDLWSKCWMHRDQQIFQWGFGADGPRPIILGQAHESETLIFEENGDRSVHIDLRGFQWMPPVTLATLIQQIAFLLA